LRNFTDESRSHIISQGEILLVTDTSALKNWKVNRENSNVPIVIPPMPSK